MAKRSPCPSRPIIWIAWLLLHAIPTTTVAAFSASSSSGSITSSTTARGPSSLFPAAARRTAATTLDLVVRPSSSSSSSSSGAYYCGGCRAFSSTRPDAAWSATKTTRRSVDETSAATIVGGGGDDGSYGGDDGDLPTTIASSANANPRGDGGDDFPPADFSFTSATMVTTSSSESSSSLSPSLPSSSPSLPSSSSLLRHWYPVALEQTLDPDRPNGVEALGRKFVLFCATDDDDRDSSSSSSSNDGDDGAAGDENGHANRKANKGGGGGGGRREWVCLDDRCSHRFAPLSEGRVVVAAAVGHGPSMEDGGRTRHLQCAYHGWEFDRCGACRRIPQSSSLPSTTDTNNSADRSSVVTYPVRTGGEMIWIWPHPDPATHGTGDGGCAQDQPLPLSPLFLEFLNAYPDGNVGFQRDLPYGTELLGENLLDISHLPFSHHSVGGLNRTFARPFQLKMMSGSERRDAALSEWDDSSISIGRHAQHQEGEHQPRKPSSPSSVPMMLLVLQAQVVNASESDPLLLANRARGNDVPVNATSSPAFYAPCHVRYRRTMGKRKSAHTELFWCPTSPGKCRVFLFNVLERFLPVNLEASVKERRGWFAKVKQRYVNARIRNLVGGSTWRGHMGAHDVFDGDGIFVRMQGDRMERDGLTPGDYCTPTSADVLVNAYRRWLDGAAGSTLEIESRRSSSSSSSATGGRVERAARAAVLTMTGGVPCRSKGGGDEGHLLPGGKGLYLDRERRSRMLDRYESHTKDCPTCSEALAKFEGRRAAWGVVSAVLLGALGASGSIVLSVVSAAVALRGEGSVVASSALRSALRAAAAMGAGAGLGAYGAKRKQRNLEKVIEQFRFVDYVHSEKD